MGQKKEMGLKYSVNLRILSLDNNCMSIKRFEDLEVWGFARDLTRRIYITTGKEQFKKDFAFQNQMRRCAVSIMANIAEGFERNTNKEFIHFLYISKGSAGELRNHLYIAMDIGYIDTLEFETLEKELSVISKSLSGFIKYLASKK
jgi:four helix bundle protein